MQRAGNRRYYRPGTSLWGRIHRLLNQEGYTVRGVQQLLREKGGQADEPQATYATQPQSSEDQVRNDDQESGNGVDVFRLELRDRLMKALDRH